MLNRLILILFIGLVYGDNDKITNPLLNELHAYADSLSLEIPLGSNVYIADHTDFGGFSSYFGGFVADQLFNHLSANDDFTILDRNPVQIILDQQNLQALDIMNERVAEMFMDVVSAEIVVFGTITEFANKININSKVVSLNDLEIISTAKYSIKKTKGIASLVADVYTKIKQDEEKLIKEKQEIYLSIENQNKKLNADLEKFKNEKLSIIKREYDIRVKNLELEEEKIIKSFSLDYQDIIKELINQKSQNSDLYSSELTKELFSLETEFKEKKAELASLKKKREQISTLDADIESLHEEIDKVSGKLSILKMGMTAEDVTQIMGPRFNYDGRCGNFGKYVLVFTNNTLIKACKIGEIYTQFGEYAVVNDCEDCDDMEVKNLLKY
ncbi:MAG: hypothetical protein CBE24_05740 [bacterium TMED264]|nr:MAG: hypothetical protein CBE24_05740 [bacterium TMED264]